MTLLEVVDARLQPALRAEWERRRSTPIEGLPRGVTVVLAGHRAAGKSRLLPIVAERMGRRGVDLDVELAKQRNLKQWVESDQPGFRRAERDAFKALPSGQVVAVGGGFLALHADLLRNCVVVEVPVSFETYVDRLSTDSTRGRLRPELSLAEELRQTFETRTRLHAEAKPLSLVTFQLRLDRPMHARRVVTLPPHEAPVAFARRALAAGAELLEIRTDLHPPSLDLAAAAQVMPLLIARRTATWPPTWKQHASVIDDEDDAGDLLSRHASEAETERTAPPLPSGGEGQYKYVEPLNNPATFPGLLNHQSALIAQRGPENVTVLCTGPFAAPFRAVLAQRNALDYLALDGTWSAAPGQRLLGDAVREARLSEVDGSTSRLGLLGSAVTNSRSPRLHRAPFDRITLPEDAPVEAIVEALHPHYAGLAITSPFKKRFARAPFEAVNTLIRTPTGYDVDNTDLEGAKAVLARLGRRITVLGNGGATVAIQLANADRELIILSRATIPDAPLTGDVIWTWPPHIQPPPSLRFDNARVVLITYGTKARHLAPLIRSLGGTPISLGPRWLVAQARRQRALWNPLSPRGEGARSHRPPREGTPS